MVVNNVGAPRAATPPGTTMPDETIVGPPLPERHLPVTSAGPDAAAAAAPPGDQSGSETPQEGNPTDGAADDEELADIRPRSYSKAKPLPGENR